MPTKVRVAPSGSWSVGGRLEDSSMMPTVTAMTASNTRSRSRGRRMGAGDRKSEVRGQGSEVRSQRPESGRPCILRFAGSCVEKQMQGYARVVLWDCHGEHGHAVDSERQTVSRWVGGVARTREWGRAFKISAESAE